MTEINHEGQPALRPLKASLLATSAMVGYFTVLVGLLYGTSSLLEKTFPGTFKNKQSSPGGKDKADPSPNAAEAPARLDLTSQSLPQPAQPAQTPAHAWPFQRPLPTTFTGRSSIYPMHFSHS